MNKKSQPFSEKENGYVEVASVPPPGLVFFATAGDRPSRQWMTCSPNFWHLINCRVSFPSLLALLSVVLFCHVCLHQQCCFSCFHTAYVGIAYMIMLKESSTILVKWLLAHQCLGKGFKSKVYDHVCLKRAQWLHPRVRTVASPYNPHM